MEFIPVKLYFSVPSHSFIQHCRLKQHTLDTLSLLIPNENETNYFTNIATDTGWV
jgi:hypothetical protein